MTAVANQKPALRPCEREAWGSSGSVQRNLTLGDNFLPSLEYLNETEHLRPGDNIMCLSWVDKSAQQLGSNSSRKSKNKELKGKNKGLLNFIMWEILIATRFTLAVCRHKHQPEREVELRLLPIRGQKSVDQPMRGSHEWWAEIICICRRDSRRSCLNFTSSNGHFRSQLSLFTIESKYSQTPITFMADWKHKDKGMKNVSASRETMSLNLSCITDDIPPWSRLLVGNFIISGYHDEWGPLCWASLWASGTIFYLTCIFLPFCWWPEPGLVASNQFGSNCFSHDTSKLIGSSSDLKPRGPVFFSPRPLLAVI